MIAPFVNMLVTLAAFCILLSISAGSKADTPASNKSPQTTHVQPFPEPDRLIKQFVTGPAFVSQCQTDDGGRHFLAIGARAGRGVLIEMREGSVENAAEVKVGDRALELGETQGGEWSYQRVLRLLQELESTPFDFVTLATTRTISALNRPGACRSIDR